MSSMRSWRVSPALLQLDREIKQAYPNRRTTSDGFIGDANHVARGSAHNPDRNGLVLAGDWDTRDNRTGKQISGMAERIRNAAIKHPSALLVIHNRKIWSRNHGWRERNYSGKNPHTNHIHVSLLNNIEGTFKNTDILSAANNTTPWLGVKVEQSTSQIAADIIAGKYGNGHVEQRVPPFPVGIGPGKQVPSAIPLQQQLKRAGFMPKNVKEHANYGPRTAAAVAAFHDTHKQFKSTGVRRDTRIGPKGWKYLFEQYG